MYYLLSFFNLFKGMLLQVNKIKNENKKDIQFFFYFCLKIFQWHVAKS